MTGLLGQAIDHHLGGRRIVQVVFDVVVTHDALALGHVQGAFVKQHAVGRAQTFEDHFDFALAALINDGVNVVLKSVADKDGAFVTHSQRTGIWDAFGVHLGFEPGWQLQFVHGQIGRGTTRHVTHDGVQGGCGLIRRHALLPGGRCSRLLGLAGEAEGGGQQATQNAQAFHGRSFIERV